MNPLAVELNDTIRDANQHVLGMLSELGQRLYFPKGILSQSAEAKKKANVCNATIGMAREGGEAMHVQSVMKWLSGLTPSEALGYAPATGNPDLRQRWLDLMVEQNPALRERRVSLPIVTNGITHGLSLVADLFADAGDAVVVPDKLWGNYRMIFGIRREAEIVEYPFFGPQGGLDTAALAQALAAQKDRKAIVILNFPNNPTGYSPTEAEAVEIASILKAAAQSGQRLVVVCDDAYFGLFYDDVVRSESLFSLLAEADERLLAVKLDGATKELYVWGLRMGFLTLSVGCGADPEPLYEALGKKVAGAIRGAISNCSQLGQSILLKALAEPSLAGELEEKCTVLRDRALKARELAAAPQFAEAWEPYPFNSGYFMCVRLRQIDGETFRSHVLDQHGIGVIATGGNDVRIAFSCVELDQLPHLFETMFQAVQELSPEQD